VGVAPAGRLGEVPAGREVDVDTAHAEGELGVRGVREHVALDVGRELRGEVGHPGHAGEERARHRRRPATRTEQLGDRIAGVQESLRLVDQVGGNVREAVALNADVEVPRRPPQRGAVHHLLEMVHAREADRGALGRVEGAEDVRRADQALGDAGGGGVAAGHHLHDARPAAQHVTHVGQRRRGRDPRLVGQHVQAGVVEPTGERHLAVVLPGQDDHVAGPLTRQPAERVGAGAHHGSPPGRTLRPAIEGLHQGEELDGLLRGIDDDLVAHEGVALAEREGRVEVAGFEEGQRVHGAGRDRRAPGPQCSAWW
jgi:hypothetical protein